MTYTQHRDTQEVLQTLEKLDVDDDANNEEEIYKRFGWEDDYHNHRCVFTLAFILDNFWINF